MLWLMLDLLTQDLQEFLSQHQRFLKVVSFQLLVTATVMAATFHYKKHKTQDTKELKDAAWALGILVTFMNVLFTA